MNYYLSISNEIGIVSEDNREYHRAFDRPLEVICGELLAFIKEDQDIMFVGSHAAFDYFAFTNLFGVFPDQFVDRFPLWIFDIQQLEESNFFDYRKGHNAIQLARKIKNDYERLKVNG